MCDFSGFKAPEMVKRRPVVIVSPNYLCRTGLYTVVPISTTEPDPIEKYHYCFQKNPMPNSQIKCWAKCDMIATVSVDRLDRIKISRGNYVTKGISTEELEAIRSCIKYALGLP